MYVAQGYQRLALGHQMLQYSIGVSKASSGTSEATIRSLGASEASSGASDVTVQHRCVKGQLWDIRGYICGLGASEVTPYSLGASKDSSGTSEATIRSLEASEASSGASEASSGASEVTQYYVALGHQRLYTQLKGIRGYRVQLRGVKGQFGTSEATIGSLGHQRLCSSGTPEAERVPLQYTSYLFWHLLVAGKIDFMQPINSEIIDQLRLSWLLPY